MRTKVLGWADTDFPGTLELALIDAEGAEHRVLEKAAVLTSTDVPGEGPLPRELWIRGESSETANGRVRVALAYGVETTDGLAVLDLPIDDVVWL